MKILTQEEKDAFNAATLQGGLRWGTVGLLGATAASVLAQKRWHNYRTGLTPALKVLPVVAATVFAVVVGADRYGNAYELSRYDLGKVNIEPTLEQKLHLQGTDQEVQLSALSFKDRTIEYAKSHRYQVVAGSWALSMIGSFGYIATTPLSFPQKLVQARMVAQFSTVAVLLASAGLAAIPTAVSEDPNAVDKYRSDDMLYKWKKDSPHAKHTGTPQ